MPIPQTVCDNTVELCESCDLDGKCAICLPGYSLTEANGVQTCSLISEVEGVTTCSPFEYSPTCALEDSEDATKTCLSCADSFSNCRICTSATVCVECSENYRLNEAMDMCVPDCDFNQFADEDGTCQACPSDCGKCQSATQCIACHTNFELNSSGSCSQCMIGDGYYWSMPFIGDAHCIPCDPNCQECTGNGKCTSCYTGHTLFTDSQNKSWCIEDTDTAPADLTCSSSQAKLESGCTSCFRQCETCSGPNYYECEACDSSKGLTL